MIEDTGTKRRMPTAITLLSAEQTEAAKDALVVLLHATMRAI